MHDDTRMGGRSGRFPATRHSVVVELGCGEDARKRLAFDALVSAYWKPVYKYLRLRHGVDSETAKDWVQGFFTFSLERQNLESFDPSKARFRTWLRVCLDRWLSNQLQSERRMKRGGQATHLSLAVEAVERELERLGSAAEADVEKSFEREWMRSLFELALEDLRADCTVAPRAIDFRIFLRYDVEAEGESDRLRYQDLADEFGVSVTKITNALHSMRRRFRAALLRRLRSVCASDEEFQREAKALLGSPR